ncbi:HpcH/HpaI aldolase/citrate lyase family protein [Nocardiopsis mangrovi]|uniref:HpcH/HpaI aldolase/citrate lyase family protein n=1 Tax=Nocardiopsis mangrovi TaxID=1179818 RepID=A0ABV9DUN4_9ACTN
MSGSIGEFASWLFVPGDRPERFDKAVSSGADGVILDLEDAVARGDKAVARANIIDYLRSGRAPNPIGVRVNAPGTTDQRADLAALDATAMPIAIFIPKVERAQDVHAAKSRALFVVAMVESAAGILRIEEILDEAPDAIMIGEADLSADLDCDLAAGVLRTAIDTVLLWAAAYRVPVIASPSFSVGDLDGVARDALAARRNGYVAKAAIHPAHIPPIERAFTPTPEEVATAQEALTTTGTGTVRGQMVDEAILRHARRIIERGRRSTDGGPAALPSKS